MGFATVRIEIDILGTLGKEPDRSLQTCQLLMPLLLAPQPADISSRSRPNTNPDPQLRHLLVGGFWTCPWVGSVKSTKFLLSE